MNKYIKVLIIITLFFPVNNIFAKDEVFHLWESGVIENVRFEKEQGGGKVYLNNKLIFNGIHGQKIEGIVTKEVGGYIYLDICANTCFTYIFDKNLNLSDLDLGFKTFPSIVRDFEGYIVFASTFPETNEWAISLFNKNENKYLGTRYVNNISINDVSIKNNKVYLKNNSKNLKKYKISSFTKTSLQEDYGRFERGRLRKEKFDKIKHFLKKYFPYILGFIILFIFIKVKKKEKTN